jgi:HCOMODA/2-hydroxy-3-carboxy-muconic semialdehyde decarboxylase
MERTLRMAARALGRHGLVHAYGHCSARIDAGHFRVCAPVPMGMMGVLGEVRLHREIYRARPDVAGVVRSMPPQLMALSTLRRTPKIRHGFGAYFYPGIPLWDDPQLIRDDGAAVELAGLLGQGRAVMMRGNGLIVAGASLEEAVVLTWYAEDAARVELAVQSAEGPVFDAGEAAKRAVWSGRIMERMWDFLTHGDPEI